MPPQLDLTGRRFGMLTVIRMDGRAFWGRDQAAWMCRCDCGAMMRLPQDRLTSNGPSHQIRSCDSCRTHPCEICAAPIPGNSASKTCSDTCAAEKSRRYQADYYYRNRRDNPAQQAARSAHGRAEWAALSPEEKLALGRARKAREGNERVNERARASYAKRMEDPEYRARRAERQREWIERNQEKVRAYSRDHRRRLRAAETARQMGRIIEETKTDDEE